MYLRKPITVFSQILENLLKRPLLFTLFTFASCCLSQSAVAQTHGNDDVSSYRLLSNILYRDSLTATDYMLERCRLDLYYPQEINNFKTVVWFHGGGLTAGNKYIPEQLKDQGFAVAAVNYRLYPQVKAPEHR